jgi:hypothetical protein
MLKGAGDNMKFARFCFITRHTDVVVKVGKTIKLDMKLQPPGEIAYD